MYVTSSTLALWGQPEVLSEFSGLAATRGRVQGSLSHCNVYYPKDGSAVWCGQAAQSYKAVYGLYDLGSVGWQLHVAEFDGVKLVY